MKIIIVASVALITIVSAMYLFDSRVDTQKAPEVLSNKTSENNTESFPALPIKNNTTSAPELSAQSAIVVDITSGVSLFEKNPDTALLPASTTKIITALVAFDYYPTEAVLKVNGVSVEGQKMRLAEGEEITVENLLYGLLVASANDAAEVLAKNFPGGKEEFVKQMNKKAKEINLDSTLYKNPSGLDDEGHFSTARDLSRASIVAMNNPVFARMVGTKEITVKSIDEKFSHNLKNVNELIGSVEGVIGVKTGWTENAHENLVSFVTRDDRQVAIVVLGSQDRFDETKELIEWVFANHQWREINPPYN